MQRKQNFVLLHGRGGRPTGSVMQLEACLRQYFPEDEYQRPALLHGDPEVPSEQSLEDLAQISIPENSTVIGISLGGLIAARLQETSRSDLRVYCVSSPLWAEGVRLEQKPENRVALYSSNDEVIVGRVSEWPKFAQAWDLPWLSHDTDRHKERLAKLIAASLRGESLKDLLSTF